MSRQQTLMRGTATDHRMKALAVPRANCHEWASPTLEDERLHGVFTPTFMQEASQGPADESPGRDLG